MTTIAHEQIAEHLFAEHEHREIASGVDRIHDVAGFVGSAAAPETSLAITEILDWVEMVLEPHAKWEDRWLYPQIDSLAGTAWATKLMTFEHEQIRVLTRKLRVARELLDRDHSQALQSKLRATLYGLDALLRAHIEREERFLLPLLEEQRSAPAAPPSMPPARSAVAAR